MHTQTFRSAERAKYVPVKVFNRAGFNKHNDKAPIMTQIHPILAKQRDSLTHQPANSGFNDEEAKKMIEFCIELNDQDSRIDPRNTGNPEFIANLDGCAKVYDSRDGLGENPNDNGFGVFENAWLLYKYTANPGHYVLAIRGTIGQKSILDDVLATTIAANAGIEFPKNRILPVTFAATPGAEVHLGFAYAAFTLLFDKQRGILKQLSDNVPAGVHLTITGHSQGAAIATLVHAFLHYALTDPSDRYGLNAKALQLKSYLFAQPKPGNAQFGIDFARIAGSRGAAFVINNHLDPVTKVPLTNQTLAEAVYDTLAESAMQGMGAKRVVIKGLGGISRVIFKTRNQIAEWVGNKTAKLYHQHEMDQIDTHYFDDLPPIADTPVNSLNYSVCGTLVPLFGVFDGGDLYPPAQPGEVDFLLQHHATTYRKLMQQV